MTRMLLAIIIVVALAPLLNAQQESAARIGTKLDALRGMGEMRVAIEDLPEGVGTIIDKQPLQTAIELKLRQNGVTVGTFAGLPTVYVNTIAFRVSNGASLSYVMSLEIHRYVIVYDMGAKSNFLMPATIWDSAILAIAPVREARADVLDTLNELLDQFLNDYLTVNPVKR